MGGDINDVRVVRAFESPLSGGQARFSAFITMADSIGHANRVLLYLSMAAVKLRNCLLIPHLLMVKKLQVATTRTQEKCFN